MLNLNNHKETKLTQGLTLGIALGLAACGCPNNHLTIDWVCCTNQNRRCRRHLGKFFLK